MKKGLIFAFSFLTLAFLIIPDFASAQLLPPCTVTGNCGLCDIIDTGVKIFRWILGLLGGSALFLFVWHGFGWLTSGGNKEKIEAARKALVHTLIGILLVLGSWFLVNMILVLLLTPADDSSVQELFSGDKEWYQYCTGESGSSCKGKADGSLCGAVSGMFCLVELSTIQGPQDSNNPLNNPEGLKLESRCSTHNLKDACEYWPQKKQYTGYSCITPDNNGGCVPGRDLGSKYCTPENSEQTCCLPTNPPAARL